MTRWQERTNHLYDSVDRWLEKYGPDAYERLKPQRDGPSGEERFSELVQQFLGPDDLVVDIGTGDAGWPMTNVATRVHWAVGFDYAARRLWHGEQRRKDRRATNVTLLLADARHIPLRDGAASAIINRRGPWTAGQDYMREGLRVLASGGLALEITIGEQNGRELEDAFGERCQMHDALATGRARLDAVKAFYLRHGLQGLVAESYVCKKSFASREALFFRLETTPAIDGFDAEADATLVDALIAAGGLSLTVHRLCLVARKTP